ncbi:MAG: ChbG/HpnK family deacetylase [Clostridiaceae bacterium]|jgi:predicted glycoside hydrolase/deacetylase ChbG (UPF0249 family)|nr:ChbG/HpnK family deacetylase [Clostridiaceae bacterium]
MNNKKFILNADDFGLSKENNRAVLDGYNNGFLTSASVCANGEAFNSAVNEILPECQNLGIGVHLNIIEGKALTKNELLTNKNNEFNNGFIALWLKSYNPAFLQEVEKEFRCQIETVMQYTKVDHIDSHVHVHSIPNLFKLTLKLAEEYKIPYIRTQYEEMYFVPNIFKHLNLKYPPNILKIILLNHFTQNNRKLLSKSDVKTNDFIIGVGYTGLMESSTVEYGLDALDDEDCIAESLIHPCVYSNGKRNQHYNEFLITQDKRLKDSIERMGFEITNYKKML